MPQPTTSWSFSVDALEARSRLSRLEEERASALREGLGGIAAYMADLEAELEHGRRLYAAAAVTESAVLRAELFGRQSG